MRTSTSGWTWKWMARGTSQEKRTVPLAAMSLSQPSRRVPAASSFSVRVCRRPKALDIAVVGGLELDAPPSPCRTSQATRSGWRSSALPMARSRRALRRSLADDCSPRQSVVWLAVARATARLCACASAGVPPLTSSSSRRCSARRTGSRRRRRRPAPAGGGTDIDEHDHTPALQARIAGANGHVGWGCAALVVGEHRGQARRARWCPCR